MDLKQEIQIRGQKAINHLIDQIHVIVKPEDPLREAVLHYPSAGGKGFRPAMLQLVCSALGGDATVAIPAAAAIEAVHVSSLIHDDIMDQDETRRGIPAVWSKWDPNVAIIAGDVLFSLSFLIVGEVDGLDYEMKYRFTKELAHVYSQLCHGQMLDIDFTESRSFEEISIDEIKEMQYLKTGVLFEFSCVTGARIALKKWDGPLIEQVREYAKLAGTAFQIQDDIIGLIGDPEETGKPVGSDIRGGKRTLIAVHAYINADDVQREIIMKALGNPSATPESIKNCLVMMKQIGSFEYAKSLAEEMASEAIVIAEKLPQNEDTKILEAFASHMIDRKL